jgi:hypothetical protein
MKKGVLILKVKTFLIANGVSTRREQSTLDRYFKSYNIIVVIARLKRFFLLDQILTLLTLEELMCTLPKKLIKPRTVLIKPGMTYFLAGLGRIDYVNGPHSLL